VIAYSEREREFTFAKNESAATHLTGSTLRVNMTQFYTSDGPLQ